MTSPVDNILSDQYLSNSSGHTYGSSDDTVGGYDGMEAVYGGCDEKYGMGGFVAVLLLVVAILLLYYVVTFVADLKKLKPTENVCGGKDQGCVCDGNEMLTGGKWPSEVSEGRLSKVTSGL